VQPELSWVFLGIPVRDAAQASLAHTITEAKRGPPHISVVPLFHYHHRVKAIVCRAYGPPESLVVEDVPSPAVRPGTVRVIVHAASVNFPDLLIIQNKYQYKPPLPFTPGTEAAGIVGDVGAGVTNVSVGDRVMAYTRCGAFAGEAVVEAGHVAQIPNGMDEVVAAGFLVTYGTAHHALADRGHVRAGETVLVLGAAGGVGLAGVEVGKALGARVIACASTDEKLAVCRAHGADASINYATEDLRGRITDLTEGRGVDVVYDPVGGTYTERALRSTAWRGRLLVIGFAAGAIPTIALNLALLKGCAIVGVSWGELMRREPATAARGVVALGEWYRAGLLKPHVSATLPLERAADALKLMESRSVIGKVVLTMGRRL
jgi:NADPH:quinone reductase